jgi:hypothetical protein
MQFFPTFAYLLVGFLLLVYAGVVRNGVLHLAAIAITGMENCRIPFPGRLPWWLVLAIMGLFYWLLWLPILVVTGCVTFHEILKDDANAVFHSAGYESPEETESRMAGASCEDGDCTTHCGKCA